MAGAAPEPFPEAGRPPRRLEDAPDWGYLLAEFHEFYRRSSAGGSAAIRAHQRLVRQAIRRARDSNPALLHRAPEARPVTAHLKRALDRGRREVTQSVVRAVESVAGELAWRHGYDRVPRGLERRYAFAEFAGPHGPVLTGDVILGVVLFAPRCIYPAHAHDGLTESYYVLSGAVSENDDGVYAPGSLIFNPPGRMHRITVGDGEPALLAYAWQGPGDKLAHQKMTFARPRG
jgi:dimethylpropiothetin dethiomethylase